MKKNKQNGFTLIELMITVAIIAILSAIALPSYQEYVQRGRIVEAVSPLSNMQSRMEQYFQDQRTYVGACVAGTLAPIPANTSFFNFTCPATTANSYQILATGTGAMVGFSYQLSQAAGATTRTTVALPAGWSMPAAGCWALKKDGSC